MLAFLISTVLSVPVVDQDALQALADSNRLNHEGPAVITPLAKVDLNGDGIEDQLVAFTFQWDENRHSRLYGQMVAAFVSTPSATFDATNVLIIPESDVIFYSDFGVEVRGSSVAVMGTKRIPGDAQCCPTARAEIVFELVDGSLKAVMGSWRFDPALPE